MRDRKFVEFRLLSKPDNLDGIQPRFLYNIVVELSGAPPESRWATFSDILTEAKKRNYRNLHAQRIDSGDSVYHHLMLWSRQGHMARR
jgi:hypothetical protein